MKQSADTIAIKNRAHALERKRAWEKLAVAAPEAARNKHGRLAHKHSLAAIMARDGLPTFPQHKLRKIAKCAARWSVRVDSFLTTCKDLAAARSLALK